VAVTICSGRHYLLTELEWRISQNNNDNICPPYCLLFLIWLQAAHHSRVSTTHHLCLSFIIWLPSTFFIFGPLSLLPRFLSFVARVSSSIFFVSSLVPHLSSLVSRASSIVTHFLCLGSCLSSSPCPLLSVVLRMMSLVLYTLSMCPSSGVDHRLSLVPRPYSSMSVSCLSSISSLSFILRPCYVMKSPSFLKTFLSTPTPTLMLKEGKYFQRVIYIQNVISVWISSLKIKQMALFVNVKGTVQRNQFFELVIPNKTSWEPQTNV